jgi:hypothetical protein
MSNIILHLFCMPICGRVSQLVGIKNGRKRQRQNLDWMRLFAICWLCWLFYELNSKNLKSVIYMAIMSGIGARTGIGSDFFP